MMVLGRLTDEEMRVSVEQILQVQEGAGALADGIFVGDHALAVCRT